MMKFKVGDIVRIKADAGTSVGSRNAGRIASIINIEYHTSISCNLHFEANGNEGGVYFHELELYPDTLLELERVIYGIEE